MPRERKCPRFSGKRSHEEVSVEEWVDEVRRSLAVGPVPKTEQALIVYDLLDGKAKAEVKFCPSSDRDDHEKIFFLFCLMCMVVRSLLLVCRSSSSNFVSWRGSPCVSIPMLSWL